MEHREDEEDVDMDAAIDLEREFLHGDAAIREEEEPPEASTRALAHRARRAVLVGRIPETCRCSHLCGVVSRAHQKGSPPFCRVVHELVIEP
jgi:hypothetical protein